LSKYICKEASTEDIDNFFKDKIKDNPNDTYFRREITIDRVVKGYAIVYYGMIDGKVISECTAIINPAAKVNISDIVNEDTAYLMNIETNINYRNKGYFTELLNYVLSDLKEKGFTKVTLSVYSDSELNKKIYASKGFTESIKKTTTILPNGEKKISEYYGKQL